MLGVSLWVPDSDTGGLQPDQLYAEASLSHPSQPEKVSLVFVLHMAEVKLSKGPNSSGGMARALIMLLFCASGTVFYPCVKDTSWAGFCLKS